MIVIAIVVVDVAKASVAQLASTGVLILFGVCLRHDNIRFVLYEFMC